MAKKDTNRISVNSFEKAAKVGYSPTSDVGWNGLNVIVKKHISLGEAVQFVNTCVKACFDAESGEYTPEVKDYALRSCVVQFYTNIALPSKPEKQYELLNQSEICEVVTPYVDHVQLNAIRCSVDEKIAHIAKANIQSAWRKIEEITMAMEDAQNAMSEAFDGIDNDDMKNIIGAIADGGIDEKKIVEAYVDSTRNPESSV